MTKDLLANSLAKCFLAGEQSLSGILDRCSLMLSHRWFWIRAVAKAYLRGSWGKLRPRHAEVAARIFGDEVFARGWNKYADRLRPKHWLIESQRMQPVGAAASWNLPRIETTGELADWFWLEHGQLEWFADLHQLLHNGQESKLRHYYYRVLTKRSGGLRLIEAPKRRLKEMQRQILDLMLDRIPAHPATHGFVKGRSIMTFATPHLRRRVVLRLDIEDFFPSFSGARLQAFFRTIGYPEKVADLLGGLCSTTTPIELLQGRKDELYSRRHLPQGAPTSPSLANLCAYRMDCRLSGLAKAAGAAYTRYADDLAFSGDAAFARFAKPFSNQVAAILLKEGFRVNHHKTRVMRQGVQQHLAGLVTNEHLNVPRDDFDRLKAILTNCLRFGAESQNREGHAAFRDHLNGRVGFVETVNAPRGARLRALFEKISWSAGT